jgi:uncharacterized protein (DUF885 family)
MFTTRRALLGGAGAALLAAGCTPPADQSAEHTTILDRVSTEILRESPERCTALGVDEAKAGGRYVDKLGDASKEGARRYRGILETALRDLNALNRAALPAQDAVTLDVVKTSFENSIATMRYEIGGGAGAPYIVTQLTGAYRDIPDFMDSQHPLRTRDEADAYLARLAEFVRQLDQETAIIGEDAAAGVIPPDFAIEKAIRQLNAFAETAPAQNVLVQSLVRRLPEVTEIPEADRVGYLTRAETAVRDQILPAYQRQVDALRAVQPRAVHDAGVWRLNQGAEMYTAALQRSTTTSMTPDEIHNIGVELIAQFTGEMDAILRAQGLTRGTVAERITAVSRRPDQLYPNTDAGRAQLLADLNAQVDAIEAMMPQAFNTLAQAPLEIKRVPVTTETGAPGGYYERASLDGSRPGAYYINLRDTAEWPKFTLPTLTYHEGVPGHHWQISIQQESGSIPFIRSALLGFSAFSEGWGLYAEQLADELGAYANNPLGRLGYLQSATFRASRLVVDTGMHAKRWTREQAIQSMQQATGDQESAVVTEIERYSVWPGQACSYMVGRQAINRMRDSARQTLGTAFDLRGFHDTMLTNGAVPLSVLESIVSTWTASVSGPAPN